MKLPPRVLIVDASHESREVLRTLLEHRGAKTIEADGPETALQLAQDAHPDLIVLDADSDRTTSGAATKNLHEAASRSHTPIVILGKMKRSQSQISSGQFLTKPYHYAPLIRKIEELLAAA